MRAKKVERIAAPAPEVFREQYLRKQKPVILQNLFAGQKIDSIRTEEDAAVAFGSLELPIQNEYLAALEEAGESESPAAPQMMTLAEYLELIRLHPGTAKMCSEKPTPPELLQSFTLPPYDDRYEDAISSFFVGNAGNYARLHFDLDFRQVLFYQVFGVKRFLLIPPAAVDKVAAAGNQSFWSIEGFREEEKRQFADFTGAYDCLLHPGETLYMPAGIWHYVEYTTNCMSFNLRFGRNAYTRFLAGAFHPSVFAQNVAWVMADETAARDRYAAAFAELKAAVSRPYSSAREKYEALESLLRTVCRRICPEYPQRDHGVATWRRVSEIYARASEQLYERSVASARRAPEAEAAEAVTANP